MRQRGSGKRGEEMAMVEVRADEKILTPVQVAKILNRSIATVYNLMNRGVLPFFKTGGRGRLLHRDAVEEAVRRGGGL